MIKKISYSLIVLFFSIQLLNAQNNPQAEKILTDLLSVAKNNAIKTSFKLTVSEKNNYQSQSTSGTFTLKGNKFVLEMEALKSWYDGKTQWSYVPQNNEVSVTEPSEKELSETNPMAILSSFKSKCLIKFSTRIKSEQNYCIEMIPKLKNDISNIEVQVNKTNGNMFSITLTNKNGSTSLLTLSHFQRGINVTDNIFTFNTSKYKGLIVNDLR